LFFLSLAMFPHVPGVTSSHLLTNLIFAFLATWSEQRCSSPARTGS